MGKSKFDQIFQALIISLLIHFGFSLSLLWAPEQKMVEAPIEIEFLNGPSNQRQQIVDETESKEQDLADQLRNQNELLSKFNKRVKQQQIARNKTGETKNRSSQKNPPKQQLDLNPKPKMNRQTRNAKNETETIEPIDRPRPQSPMGNLSPNLAIGDSTSGNDIPGVKIGEFTALNTNQFTYYSFFERVNNAIRFRWVTGVRRFSREASPRTINQLAKVPSATVIRVLLDKDGMVVDVQTLSSSGSKQLDEAAINAFYQASPLNHPPDGMIARNGMVELNYSFRVTFQRVYMAKDENSAQ